MKKVIVTGGLGFIGSHLVEMLLNKGVEVIIIDNKSTNVIEEDFFKNKNCKVIINSIKDVNLDNIRNIDTVFHLASILGPSGVLKHAGDIGISVLSDVIKVRDYCISNNAEVYGHMNLLKEDSEKIFPGEYKIRTEYGAGKMIAEMALVNKSKIEPRLIYHLIRPFNVTGQRQKPDGGFVLPRFVIAALTEQPITVFGDGTQKRAFTHVKDICDAIILISESKYKNEIWNVGNPENSMTIQDMAEEVIKLTKNKYPKNKYNIVFVDPKTIHGPLFEEAVEKIPYIEKIKNKIGWKPKFSFSMIFGEVIEFYDKKINEGYKFDVLK
jgi:nucleoside-diphosphate-sugar epimerase